MTTTLTDACPRCEHDAYDIACDEYQKQMCCGYVVHVDDLGDADSHYEECENAPEWMTR